MCDLSVLVEDYNSLPPAAEKIQVPYTFEEFAMRLIVGMLPVLVCIARTTRETVALTVTVSLVSVQQVQAAHPCRRRRKRGSAVPGVIHLVVWGSPSTGYWTSLSFGSNKRQVFICCQLLLHCAVVCGAVLCYLALSVQACMHHD